MANNDRTIPGDNAGSIANLSHHQTITDALLTTMGECMAVQQSLANVPSYDGKNIPLKTFLQDVENGFHICPVGIQQTFFRGVIAKLRDTARDAVGDTNITSIEQLRDVLKEYFAPKKNYSHYCAELQASRMRKDDTVMEYYSRIKKIMDSAKASLKEKFAPEQVPHMILMLEGLALESFKRGLPDDLMYAMSVQEPTTLAAAIKIAQRVERDMTGANNRKGVINLAQSPDRHVQFKDEAQSAWDMQGQRNENRPQSRTPWRSNSPGPSSNAPRAPDAPYRGGQRESRYQNFSRSPIRSNNQPTSNYRAQTPPRYQQQQPMNVPFQYAPQAPFPYPPVPYGMIPPMNYAPFFYGMPQPLAHNKSQENLNEQLARRTDASTSQANKERLPTVKFISAEELQKTAQEEGKSQ